MSLKKKASSVVFQKIIKKFGETVAVNDVSFVVEAGSLVTLLGPSGCGKTTCLRMIAGLELPTAGKILIGGKDVTLLPATERDVTMVFQSYALFPHMNVIENVSYGLLCSGYRKKEATERAQKWLSVVGLQGFENRLSSELSGGQQQRVAVARALVLEPEVLLFDEPLSNLDAKLRRKMREDIRELQQRLGITSVYVTHDQSEALAISDKIIVMDKACVAQEGTPRELYEHPQSLFVANFMGDANVVEGEVILLGKNAIALKIGTMTFPLSSDDAPRGLVRVSIRPEAITVSAQKPKTPALTGEVIQISYLGSHMEYKIQSEGGELFVVDKNVGAPFQPKQRIYLGLAMQGLAIIPGASNSEKELRNLNKTQEATW